MSIILYAFDAVRLNLWFSIFLILLFVAVLFVPIVYDRITNRLSYRLAEWKYNRTIKKAEKSLRGNGYFNFNEVEGIINKAGYAYNSNTDVFFSTMWAWQRKMGYCRLYDEGAAPFGLIIDSEPIRFSYRGKRWLIEFWKGQYDLCCGGEVGIYVTEMPDLNIPGFFDGTFYHSVSNRDRLHMSFIMYKNGEEYMRRSDQHWWLTGFKLGEYAEPWELSMDIYIYFKNRGMRDAFLESLKKTGYVEGEFETRKNTVALRFDKPKTKQPYTRTPSTDALIQAKNKLMCDTYQAITKNLIKLKDKVSAVKNQSPELYQELFKIGKPVAFYDAFSKISEYLNLQKPKN